jgi:hypothetical protein
MRRLLRKGEAMIERDDHAAPTPPLEALQVTPMANGWACILLTERVGYDEFPAYARVIASLLRARLVERFDLPDLRMRGLWLGLRRPFWIVFDDFPLGVTIEPRTRSAASDVHRLYRELAGHTP